MAIQNNLEAPITATSAADALKQYEEAKKAKKAAPASKPKAVKKAAPKKAKNHGDKKRTKKAKAATKEKKAKRTFKAAVTGTTLKSRMVRISTDLADFLTAEASKSDITVTEASRILVEGLLK